MKKSLIIKTLFFLIIITGVVYFIMSEKNIQGGRTSRTGKAKKIDLIQRVTIAGNISPLRKTIVTAPFNGYVKKLFVKIGDKIKKGQPIVSVVQSLQSTDPLFPLRSPLDGTVVSIQKQEGEFVKQDDAQGFILRIDSLDELYINSNVPEIDMVKIKVGLEAIIKISAILDRKYKGEVVNISLASKAQEGWNAGSKVEFPTRTKIINPDHQVKPGMSAILDIITLKRENVLALEHEFISKEGSHYYVFLKNGDKRNIEVGIQNEAHFEITKGLSEGEEVKQVDFLELLKNENK